MKTLRLLAILCTTLVLCNSCLKGIGWEEEQNQNNQPDDKPQTGLVLTATPSTIEADGEDVAVLEVTFNGEALTEGFTLYDGEDNEVTLENMEFRTETIGKYSFWASYDSYISETITIDAVKPAPKDEDIPEGPEDSDPTNLNFKRRVLLIQFTGTGCGYCPGMTSTLRSIMADEAYANDVILTAAHLYNQSDPAYLNGYRLDNAMGVSNYPSLIVDMHSLMNYYQIPNYVETVQSFITNALDRIEAKAGIAATSVVEENTLIINATVKAAVDTKLRIGAWLIEDGIYGKQTNYGVAEGDFDIHDHCIRVADSKVNGVDYSGYAVGPVDEEGNVLPMKKGETAEYVFSIDLKDKWVRDNCSIVLFVSAPEKKNGTEYFYVNNVVKMPLEGQITYEYAEEDTEEDTEE